MKLNDAVAAGLELPAGKTEHFVWDEQTPSFGVRIRVGSKRWCVQYRVGRQQRRESLGDNRKVKCEAARQRFASVELGADPGADRAKARAEAAAIKLTIGSLVGPYLEAKKDELRPASLQAARRYLENHSA